MGKRIRTLRASRNLSQEQLAERAGVSYKFVGDVERGKGNPTVNWLEAVAIGLGVTVTDLLTEEDPAVLYPPITGRDYIMMREAKDRLEGLLERYASEPAKRLSKRKTQKRRIS